MKKNDSHSRIDDFFRKAGIPLTPRQSQDFSEFFDLFQKYNDEYDLSRIKKSDEIIVKHLIDCALVQTLVDIPSPVLDIGTGAGFPGIPLKIMNRDLRIILAEPKDKRVLFMEMIIDRLKLEGATVYPKRVADHCDFEVNGVITRAFEAVDGTLSRVKHFLPKGGKVIFMKGPAVEEDLGAMSPENLRDYRIAGDREYTLPATSYSRRIVVFEKITDFREHVYTETDPRYAKCYISSPDNGTFKELKKLAETKGVRKSGMTVVSGKKVVLERAVSSFDSGEYLVVFDEYRERDSSFNEIIQKYHGARKLLILKKSLFNELDFFSTGAPLLICRYPELKDWSGKADGCTLLVPFQDPSNVGAVIRSAAAFGVKKAVILAEGAHPFNPKCVRSSSGAVFSMEMETGPSIDEIGEACANVGVPVVALDAAGTDIRGYDFPENFFLLPGLEGQGIPENLRKKSVSIPIENNVESLNASSATAVVLFYLSRIGK
jgi:16S rRNA (guanine527-N7)-methyltransferase